MLNGNLMDFNQYSLYSLNAKCESHNTSDKVDIFIDSIKFIDEFDDVKNVIVDKFGEFKGDKWIDYDELHKNIYLKLKDDIIEVCALKNDKQYFGKGWKLISSNT